MAQIVKWNDIAFSLGGSSLLGIEGIGITGSCETEDSTVDGEKFVKRKNGKPYEIEMTALLDARLGIDVQSMATKMTEAARCSASGYFYTGSAKLFPCSFMMISAAIGEIILNPNGQWISCEVKLKLKQSTKFNGSTTSTASSSSSGSGGSSSSKASTTSKPTTSSHVDAISSAAPKSSSGSSKVTTKTTLSSSTISAMQNIAQQIASSAVKTASQTTKTAQSQSSSIVKKASSSSGTTASKVVKSNVNNKVKAMLK